MMESSLLGTSIHVGGWEFIGDVTTSTSRSSLPRPSIGVSPPLVVIHGAFCLVD